MERPMKFYINYTKNNMLEDSVNQGDSIYMTCYFYENGLEKNITNENIQINYTKADMKTVSVAGPKFIKANGNELKAHLPEECTAAAGECLVQIVFTKDGRTTSTFPISIKVVKSIFYGKASINLSTMLNELLNANIDVGNSIINMNNTKEECLAAIEECAKTYVETANLQESVASLNSNIIELNYKDLIGFTDKCVVTIIDDDAQESFITAMKPVLDAKGVKASIATMGRDVGVNGEMTIEQLKELELAGHDVVSHAWANELHKLKTNEELDNELTLAKKFMLDNNFKGKDCIVYPTGFANDDTGIWVKQHVRKFFKYGVNAWESVKNPIDSLYIGRVDFNNSTIETLTTKLEDYVKRNDWLVLMVHSWQPAFSADKLGEFIDLCKNKDIPILNFTDASKIKGNILSAGEYTRGGISVDSMGRVSSNFVVANMDNVMAQTPLDYPNNSTFTEVLDHWVEGMPIFPGIPNTSDFAWARYGGILFTFRGLGNENYCRQTFLQTGLFATTFTRYWSESSSRWGSWKCTSSVNHCGSVDGKTYETLAITSFPMNSITAVQIYNNSWELINGKGGTLTTYRSQDDAYAYQEFTPYDSATKYKRMWNNAANEWGDFIQYS